MKNDGVRVDPSSNPDTDWVEANWSGITDLSNAYPMWNIGTTRARHDEEVAAGVQPARQSPI